MSEDEGGDGGVATYAKDQSRPGRSHLERGIQDCEGGMAAGCAARWHYHRVLVCVPVPPPGQNREQSPDWSLLRLFQIGDDGRSPGGFFRCYTTMTQEIWETEIKSVSCDVRVLPSSRISLTITSTQRALEIKLNLAGFSSMYFHEAAELFEGFACEPRGSKLSASLLITSGSTPVI